MEYGHFRSTSFSPWRRPWSDTPDPTLIRLSRSAMLHEGFGVWGLGFAVLGCMFYLVACTVTGSCKVEGNLCVLGLSRVVKNNQQRSSPCKAGRIAAGCGLKV
jgi:hypothetical protein